MLVLVWNCVSRPNACWKLTYRPAVNAANDWNVYTPGVAPGNPIDSRSYRRFPPPVSRWAPRCSVTLSASS